MWPLALLLVCIMVGGVVYFLIADQNFSTHSAHELYAKKGANSNEPNAINFLNNYNSVNRNNRTDETNRKYESQTPPLKVVPSTNNHNYANQNYNPRPPPFSTSRATTASPRPLSSSSPPSIFIRSTTPKTYSVAQTSQPKSLPPIIATATTTTSTARPLSKNDDRDTSTVKNVKVYTNSNSRRKLPQPAPKHTTLLLPTSDDLEDNVVERSKLLFPSKETLENFGFTSGHQNSFGIPIEEDERVLRILNYQMFNSQPKQTKQKQSDDFLLLSITTDANVHQTKVSPTLPNIKKHFTSTERIRASNATNTDDGNLVVCLFWFYFYDLFSVFSRMIDGFVLFLNGLGICQSTTLPLCRGILPYDLTNVKMVKTITPQDLEHFQYLIESKCSKRSHEFVCSILEPECRPERMGPLLPCKRICKGMKPFN